MLAASALTVRYGRRVALDEISWSVSQGERVVLLGPNGAGKSTLMHTFAGLRRPASGRVELANEVSSGAANRTSAARDLRRHVGCMPQAMTAVPRLNVIEQVTYAGWLAGHSRDKAGKAAAEALVRVGLADRAGQRATTLSGGQLRRLGLAEALVHGGEFLLLDEPTAGLDPAQRARFREVLGQLTDRGIVMSTHETHDLADLFTRVTVLTNGKVRFDGSLSDFTTVDGRSSVSIERAYLAIAGE